MARPRSAAQLLRFRLRCRSRRRCRHPHQHRVRAPVPDKVDAEHPSGQPHICRPTPIPTAVMHIARQGENRKTHSSPPGARGFLLWRISYICRCPISFTHSATQRGAGASRKRTPVHVTFFARIGRRWTSSFRPNVRCRHLARRSPARHGHRSHSEEAARC